MGEKREIGEEDEMELSAVLLGAALEYFGTF